MSENGYEPQYGTSNVGGVDELDADYDESEESVDALVSELISEPEKDEEPQAVHRDLKTAVGSSTNRPKAGQFSWSDVESIIKFVATFESGTTRNKEVFKSIFGIAAKADALTVAQGIHTTTSSISVYKDATSFIETIVKKSFGMTELFALLSDLSRRDDDYARDFFKVVNAFLKDEVRYRKNAPLPSMLQGLVEGAQNSLTQDDKKVIDWIGTLLSIWPK